MILLLVDEGLSITGTVALRLDTVLASLGKDQNRCRLSIDGREALPVSPLRI